MLTTQVLALWRPFVITVVSVLLAVPFFPVVVLAILGTGRLEGLAVRIKSTAKPWILKTSLAVRSVPVTACWCLLVRRVVPTGA